MEINNDLVKNSTVNGSYVWYDTYRPGEHTILDAGTENNVDNWIPVFNSGKLQHTTIASLVSRGDVATRSTKGLMSPSDRIKLDDFELWHCDMMLNKTVTIDNVWGYQIFYIFGISGTDGNRDIFYGTVFHSNFSGGNDAARITGDNPPIIKGISSSQIKITFPSTYGQLYILSAHPMQYTVST